MVAAIGNAITCETVMEIENSFEVPLPTDQAWAILLDIKKIAPCMPGAELIDVVDPKTYKGRVSVRLGPVALSFVGTAHFEEANETAHRVRMRGQGSDSKGRGGASGVVTFALSSIEGGTRVDVDTKINLSGAVAQYGRGSGMIQDVATQIIDQFAAALRAMLEHDKAEQAATGQAGGTPAALEISPATPKPISGFSLIVRVLWNALCHLFGAET
jgi:carbon monoxide dehydrogenase subunit G